MLRLCHALGLGEGDFQFLEFLCVGGQEGAVVFDPLLPELLQGALVVEGDLAEDATPRTSITNAAPAQSPWMAWKAKVQAELQ